MKDKADSSSTAAQWVQAIGTVASALVGVIAGYFALTTYMDSVSKQVDERKVQVFRLHERFTSEPMLSVRKRIYGDIVRASGCNWQNDITAQPSDQNDRFAFVEFFDVLDACLTAKLCDAELVDRFFTAYANGHWQFLSGYVGSVRNGEAPMKLAVPFGSGLQRLAKNPQRLSC